MSKKNKAQIWAEYALAKGIMASLSILPGKASVRVGRVMGRITLRGFAKLRRVGMRNLELAFPEMPVDERSNILKGAF